MSIRKYKPEQTVGMLRQIKVQMANGKTAPQAYSNYCVAIRYSF